MKATTWHAQAKLTSKGAILPFTSRADVPRLVLKHPLDLPWTVAEQALFAL